MNQNNNNNNNSNNNNNHLINNIKKQYKELKKENEKLNNELISNKKNKKVSHINEINIENQIFLEQITKLQNLYNHTQTQNSYIQQNISDYSNLKEDLNKKDYLIVNFQENFKLLNNEINKLNNEIEKLTNQKNNKTEIVNKLKNKLKEELENNEKLILRKENIQNSEDYLNMKNKYEMKIQKIKKEITNYKDQNAKNEKMIRDLNSNKNNINILHSFDNNDLNNNKNEEKKFPDFESAPKKESNSKILLIQSLLKEIKTENKKYEKEIENLQENLKTFSKKPTQVILQNSYSTNDINVPININDYEFFSDFNLQEFIYVLIKNLEANKIDMSIIESRVLLKENLNLLKNKKYKEFIANISRNLIEILKIKNEKDQNDIFSFVKTFLYNNYIKKNLSNPEEFYNKILSLFTNINFYSLEQRQELNKIITSKFLPIKNDFLNALIYFDENNTGYISFTILKTLLKELNLNLKNEVLEYLIYIMKVFPEEDKFLRSLKIDNLIKIIEETEINPNENYDIDDDKKDDDDAIEITNEEYLNKVKNIIARICKQILSKKKTVEEIFGKIISKSIKDFKAIRLVHLVDVLKTEFNIELSNIEIFCLFTKIKPGNEKENEDDVEEIVDYEKLKNEIEEGLRHPNSLKTNNKANSTKNINKKLNYSDKFEKAKEKKTNNNNVVDEVKNIFNDFMKKHKFSFERFIFPVHCMMKLTTNGKKYNRYLEIEFFKHFLYQNGILIHIEDLNKFLQSENLLLNNEKVNIDFLKFILSGRKGIRDNIINEFMIFKPIENNVKNGENKNDINNIKNNFKDEEKKDYEFEDSESVRMLQKEIYGEDEEIEDNLIGKNL